MFPSKSLTAVLFLIMGAALICRSAQGDQTPPKELIEYVREARHNGLAEAKIQKQAAAVGWSEAMVAQAIAYDKSGKPLPESQESPGVRGPVAAEPPTVPVASFEVPRQDPVATAAAAREKSNATGDTPARSGPDDYRIGSGDTLQISVWEQADLSVPSQVVRSDGKVTMPLIKEVAVAGMTPRQAETKIAAALGKFVTDPVVTVVVTLPTSKKVYLVGAVRKEGTLPYTYGITVMQALSEAGGLNDYAKRSKIYILRTENGREYRFEFNYKEVIRGERMEQNIVLMPGDTVVVPQ
jgi:polysaccharide export outer membrane protein